MVEKKTNTTKRSTGDSRPRKTRKQLLAERRSKRTDLGTFRDVMTVPQVAGKRFYWTNDQIKGGRNAISRMEKIGWQIYTGDFEVGDEIAVERDKSMGDAHKIVVGMNGTEPLYAVLMWIDEDVYKADQSIKEEELKATEEGLREEANAPGMYGTHKTA